mmetsp:Transcript_25724/g.59468  ORF Transcript_25724/g.59468 Transcript_25724/m.59468 type:complete len:132 (-) Transcript_25724:54-449(-)
MAFTSGSSPNSTFSGGMRSSCSTPNLRNSPAAVSTGGAAGGNGRGTLAMAGLTAGLSNQVPVPNGSTGKNPACYGASQRRVSQNSLQAGNVSTSKPGSASGNRSGKGAAKWQAMAWPDRFGEPVPMPTADA